MHTKKFGRLITNKKQNVNVNTLHKEHLHELNYIFGDINTKLNHMTVIEAERKRALENLRFLTHTLQKNRIKAMNNSTKKY